MGCCTFADAVVVVDVGKGDNPGWVFDLFEAFAVADSQSYSFAVDPVDLEEASASWVA